MNFGKFNNFKTGVNKMEQEKSNEIVTNENAETQKENKKKVEDICRKIMRIVIPCIAIMLLLIFIFDGSATKEARGVKSALKKEGCDAVIYTDAIEITNIFEDLAIDIKNVDEMVVASDSEDEAVFAFVLFCETRSDAEDIEKELMWLLSRDLNATSYWVERNARVVCLGHNDLVEVVMDKLN